MDAIPPHEIGYYSPTAGLGARAARTLKGFPGPRGAQSGEWPLNDRHLAELAAAERHRKVLRGFNSFCQFLTLGSALGAVVFLITIVDTRPVRNFRGPMPFEPLAGAALCLALALLYFAAGRAALKCQIWGPITVTALIALALISWIVTFLTAMNIGPRAGARPELIAPLVFTLIIGGIFLALSLRAVFAVPKFLASPLWAQEALVNAKL